MTTIDGSTRNRRSAPLPEIVGAGLAERLQTSVRRLDPTRVAARSLSLPAGFAPVMIRLEPGP